MKHFITFNCAKLSNIAKNGVVIATERKLPALVDPASVQKIELVSDNIAITYAGMGPDFRVLVRKGTMPNFSDFRLILGNRKEESPRVSSIL